MRRRPCRRHAVTRRPKRQRSDDVDHHRVEPLPGRHSCSPVGATEANQHHLGQHTVEVDRQRLILERQFHGQNGHGRIEQLREPGHHLLHVDAARGGRFGSTAGNGELSGVASDGPIAARCGPRGVLLQRREQQTVLRDQVKNQFLRGSGTGRICRSRCYKTGEHTADHGQHAHDHGMTLTQQPQPPRFPRRTGIQEGVAWVR